ncbi:MAG: hypothetical protein V4672_13125 [Verrucomicrobiota bacterium]
MNRAPTASELAKTVAIFNATVSKGDAVIVTLDSRETKQTVTRSEAFILGGHSAMVMLEGISGAYAVERVQKVY